PGDVRVKNRLDDMLASATRPERAKLLFARAVWSERLARRLEASGAGVEEVASVWRQAASDAIGAGDLLEFEGAFIDAERAAKAWVIASDAVFRTEMTPNGRTRQLTCLVRAARCVAEL